MPTRELLSPAQRVQFTTLAPLSARDLARYYTLSAEDLAAINRRRRPHNRLGFAVQLAYLRFPGRPLQAEEPVPPAVVAKLAGQVGVDPAVLDEYARERAETRREHLQELQRTFGFRPFDARAYRELAAWLLPTALGTDAGVVLVAALLEELRARRIVAPALSTVERLGWETRRRAQRLVFARLTAGLTESQRHALDALLVTPPGSGRGARAVPLTDLRQPPGRPTPATFLRLVTRLQRIRALGLDPAAARGVHQNRLLRLAREGARYSPYFLQRFPPERRYATLVAFLLEAGAGLTDQALALHDRLIGQFHAASRQAHAEQFQHSGRALTEKVRLYAAVGKALIAAKEQADDPFAAIGAILPWDAFVRTVDEAERLARSPAFGPLALLDASYRQLRRYAPTLLDTFAFAGPPASRALLEALALLRRLNADGRQRVPREAPTDFVPPRWEPHVNGE